MSQHEGASFRLRVDDRGVGRVTIDQPDSTVNVLDTSSMEELDALLEELEGLAFRRDLEAVVLVSGKDANFVAGADVDEIAGLTDPDEATAKARRGQQIYRRLEALPVPTVAAVHGTCLGGGTEMILACDHRVASDANATKIGLPEVKLGILPGFGGTVRLPRLCGLQNALDVILAGRSVSSDRAKRIGLVDRVVGADGFDGAVEEFVGDVLAGRVGGGGYRKSLPERLLEDTAPGRWLLFRIARKKTAERTEGNYPAPLRALEVIRETYGLPLSEAFPVEARAVGELAVTPEAKNLIRVFQLTRRAKKALPEEVMESRREVEKVGVLGAGVMGGAIAELAAANDVPAVMKDIERDALDEGLHHARGLLEKAARKGVFDQEEVGLKWAMIDGTLDYGAFGDVDLVIEAVVEKMEVKQQVLREAEEVLPEAAVFSTNTSSLSVDDIASASARPGRVVGLHFFNPVHKMPLVEVVRGEASSDEALATALGFAVDMGKNPVVVNDGPGFLVNRLLAPYLNEAGHLLAEGAGVRAVDRALTAFGMPMGPCRLLDEVGLDVALHVSEVMEDAFGDRMRASDIVQRLLDDGRLGKKGGRGFYLYEDGREEKVDPALRDLLPRPETAPPPPGEARRRCLYLMVNEAAHALEDGIVDDPGMVDLAMVMGTGFPPFRGGVLRWADVEGTDRIVRTLRDYRERLGDRFRPADLLASRAEAGETFTDPVFL